MKIRPFGYCAGLAVSKVSMSGSVPSFSMAAMASSRVVDFVPTSIGAPQAAQPVVATYRAEEFLRGVNSQTSRLLFDSNDPESIGIAWFWPDG